MSNTSIQVVHSDITITYNEGENKWDFVLRGRDRSADSLEKAREFIDKPVPEKAKPFERIPVWEIGYNDDPKRAEVTGIAEARYGREMAVWVLSGRDRRKVHAGFRIYPCNEKNDAAVALMIEKRKAIKKLSSECETLRQKLSPLVLPKDE